MILFVLKDLQTAMHPCTKTVASNIIWRARTYAAGDTVSRRAQYTWLAVWWLLVGVLQARITGISSQSLEPYGHTDTTADCLTSGSGWKQPHRSTETHSHTCACTQNKHIIGQHGDTWPHLLVIPSHLGVGDGDNDHLLGGHPGGHHYPLPHKTKRFLHTPVLHSQHQVGDSAVSPCMAKASEARPQHMTWAVWTA